MCTVPSQIQSQFSEAIALIATIDFPKKWDNLLNDLIQKFHSPDPNIVSGVLLTLSSILKRFKQQVKSDELYADLAYVLERLQEPLLTLLKSLSVAVDSYANDANKLKPIFASLRSICRIFYSLNYHDLPEYFEDHMGEWMTEFAKYLKYTNPLLVDEDEDDEAGPIDTLQSAIILNLYLYGDKDEEPFIPYLGEFTSIVWNLLMNTSKKSKHDMLATTCIKFLSSLIGKPMHRALFQSKETLQQIISNIVIPNLQIREVDQEQFEDDPAEFILSDMEESDSDSRRKRSQELLRAMCRQFEEETTLICMESIGKMLQEFTASNGEKWISKDAAVSMILDTLCCH
jgi:exportin-2 (importin alpha re-exporter)